MIRLLRLPEVLKLRGTSRTAHYADMENRTFPAPIKLALRGVGWPEYEVDVMNRALIAGMTVSERQQIVIRLEGQRKAAMKDADLLIRGTP